VNCRSSVFVLPGKNQIQCHRNKLLTISGTHDCANILYREISWFSFNRREIKWQARKKIFVT